MELVQVSGSSQVRHNYRRGVSRYHLPEIALLRRDPINTTAETPQIILTPQVLILVKTTVTLYEGV